MPRIQKSAPAFRPPGRMAGVLPAVLRGNTPAVALAVVLVVVIAGLSSCGGASAGEPQPLQASEIQDALAGNTIIGEWVGEPYRQYFDEDGSTVYAPTGARTSTGRWRVGEDPDADRDSYESWWNERDGWERYAVLRLDDTFYWTGAEVELSPFTVVPGRQLQPAEG